MSKLTFATATLVLIGTALPAFAQMDIQARGLATKANLRASVATASAVYAADYGAKCDGATDDSGAFNAAINAVRSGVGSNGSAYNIGKIGKLIVPRGLCVITSTINMTNMLGAGFVIDFAGSLIDCRVTGGICIDAAGSGGITIENLNIQGNPSFIPKIGLVLARKNQSLANGAGHNRVSNLTIGGYFSLANYYARSTETTVLYGASLINYQANAYVAIWDGSNHFNIQSAFTGVTYPADVFSSNNENTCIDCDIEAIGVGTVPIWMGGTGRHKFYNGYAAQFTGGGVPAVQLYFGTAANPLSNDFLMFDMHIENGGLAAGIDFLVSDTGRALTVKNLRVEDHQTFQSGPYFRLGTGVTSIDLQNLDANLGMMSGTSPSWWSNPSAFKVSGKIYSGDNSYVAPSVFTGSTCLTSGCNATYTLPSNLQISSLQNSGGVSSITTSGASLLNGSPTTVTIAAPPTGGQQATAYVSRWQIINSGAQIPSGGSGGAGYQVGDVLNFVGGIPISGAKSITVTSVDGSGQITGFAGNGNNLYSTIIPAGNTQLSCGSPCHGTGAYILTTTWQPSIVTVSAAGSGYTSVPAATVSSNTGGGALGTSTVTLNSAMTIGAANGSIVLSSFGVTIGSPLTLSGALAVTTRLIVSGSSITGGPTDSIVVINKATGSPTTYTLATPTADQFLTIKDGKGDASTNNIIISGNIDGGTSLVINAAYGVTRLFYSSGAGKWFTI